MHQRIASTMLDLPHPFGPTTPVIDSPMFTTARSQNDLKPMISTRLMRMARVAAPWQIPLTLVVLARLVTAAPIVEIKAQTRLALDHVRLTGEGQAEVAGQLVDKLTGEGLANQALTIEVDGKLISVTTGNDGRFSLKAAVPSGRVKVDLKFRGGGALDKAELTATTDPSRAQVALAMTAAESPAGSDLTITATADDLNVRLPLELTWSAPSDSKHQGATHIYSGQPLTLTRKLAGGPGPYHVNATFPGDGERQPAHADLSLELTSTTSTSIVASTTALPFEDELAISGKVTDADGAPVRAPVTLLAGDRRLAQGVTKDDGSFALAVEGEVLGEGTWGMQVSAEPAAKLVRSSKSNPVVIRVAAPQPVPVSYTIAAFLATALAAGGFFAARTKFWRRWQRKPTPADAAVSDEGVHVESLDGGLVTGKPTLAATLRRPHDDGFGGVVRDTIRGRAIPEGVVRLLLGELAPGDSGSADGRGLIEREIRTAADGSFAIEGLAPGEWRAEVAAPGHVTETFTVTIPHRGELRGVRIDLVPVRERVFQLYRRAAEPTLPEPRLWGIWSPRQIVDHVRTRKPSPALSELTDFVEEIYFSPRLAAEGVLPGTSERVDRAIRERQT